MYLTVQCPSGHTQEECSTGNKKHKKTRRAGPGQKGKFCDTKNICDGYRLTFGSFGKNRSKRDGLQPYCKDCDFEYRQVLKKDEKWRFVRYGIATGRLDGLKGSCAGFEGRLARFLETGEYRPPGQIIAAKRLKKDLEGSGRIRKSRRRKRKKPGGKNSSGTPPE